MKSLIFFLIVGFWSGISLAGKTALKLKPELKRDYLVLLEKAADFHKVIEKGDRKAIETEIKETQEIIARLYSQIFSVSQFHHRIHSHKLLKSIEEQLAVMRSKSSLGKSTDKRNIKKLFNSFFELAQVYDLRKDIKDRIFYCSRDRSLWFQEKGKARNPINLDYKNCGRVIL